jgi:hypothetical protein
MRPNFSAISRSLALGPPAWPQRCMPRRGIEDGRCRKLCAGGQAGSSSLIENFFGFPTGIGGGELTWLAQLQAYRFGAKFSTPAQALSLQYHADGEYRACLETEGCGAGAPRKSCPDYHGADYGRSKPRAANNSKVSAFITLPPRWRVSFVATKLLLSRQRQLSRPGERCSFPTARPRYYLSLGETTLPTRCRTIFRVGWRPRKTLRFSTTLRSAKCQAEKSWNKSNWKIRRQASADRSERRLFFDDRRETKHRMVAARNRAGRQRIHQDRDERRYGASMAVEQTSTRPSRDKLAGNFCRGRRALRVGETLRRSSRRRRHGRRRCPNQVGFVILNPDPRRLRNASIDKGPAPPRISAIRPAMYSRLIS